MLATSNALNDSDWDCAIGLFIPRWTRNCAAVTFFFFGAPPCADSSFCCCCFCRTLLDRYVRGWVGFADHRPYFQHDGLTRGDENDRLTETASGQYVPKSYDRQMVGSPGQSRRHADWNLEVETKGSQPRYHLRVVGRNGDLDGACVRDRTQISLAILEVIQMP